MNGLNLFKSRFIRSKGHSRRSTRASESSSSLLPVNPHRSKRAERNSSVIASDKDKSEKERVSSPSRKRSISNAPVNNFSSIEEEDPLQFLQVKSAAQWKALSQRIQWIEESENKDDSSPSDILVGSPSKKQRNVPKLGGESPHSPKNRTIKSYTIRVPSATSSVNSPEGFVPTKVAALRLVCWRFKPWKNKSNQGRRRLFSSQFAVQWNVDCDEVYPSLFIGDKNSASNLRFLKKLGITHVLNTAEGDEEGLVNLSQSYYEDTNIVYKGFPLWDCPNCNIFPYLGPAADFIKSSIQGGGKCLINCQMGVSRSATCALSYLMIHEEMTATQALSEFRAHRDVRPNDGFLEILAGLDNELRKEREFGIERSIELASLGSILPTCQNTEFWVDLKEISEEDVGGTLISLFEEGQKRRIPSNWSSKTSKSSTPRRWSRSISGKSSFRNSRAVSRNSSLYDKSRRTPVICVTPPEKECLADVEDNFEEGDDWEWVWEYEDEENVSRAGESSPLTTRKLEEVKDIIEKPEERWRILWDKRNVETPSSVGSLQSRCSSLNKNLIQPKANEGEILNSLLVQVDSARKWKSISQKLSINFDDINISECQASELEQVASNGKCLLPEESLNGSDEVNAIEERPPTPSDFKPTLAKQLRILCWKIKPWDQPKDRNLFTSIMGTGWGVDCDEIYPQIFLGDEASARNLAFLKKIKVTHVLNAAQGIWTDYSFVDLNKDYYEGSGITYQGFELWDHPGVNIERYFGPANEFIASCIEGGGRVLIHCQMGVSRSCVCAMAYLMLTKGFTAVETLKIFRSRRDVHPNDHFLSQIADLDNKLRKERDYNIPSRVKLHALSEVDKFPKPFHFEFWDSVPDNESLPFILRRKGDQEDTSSSSGHVNVKHNCLEPSNEQSCNNSCSSSEWEYYTETEEDLSSNE